MGLPVWDLLVYSVQCPSCEESKVAGVAKGLYSKSWNEQSQVFSLWDLGGAVSVNTA